MGQPKPKPSEAEAEADAITETKAAPDNKPTPLRWKRELGTKPTAFAAAVAAHGWREHKAHTGDSFELSRTDYQEAVKAAYERSGVHAPAVSKYRGRGI